MNPSVIKKQIQQAFEQYTPHKYGNTELTKSAVLVPLIPHGESYSILLTSRSPHLRHHKGEMSFPGGKFDPILDQTLQDTAIRETFEEIGVPRENILLLGQLDEFPTLTGYLIRPIIGILQLSPNYTFSINRDEVASLVNIPIEYLKQKHIFNSINYRGQNKPITILSFNYHDPRDDKTFNIWGATAHILASYMKIVYNLIVTPPDYHRPSLQDILEYKKQRKSSKNV